jgi:hypothetical protein
MKAQPVLQEFFVAGGTLWREAPSYIVRPADEELYRLALAGEYCNVLAARQMGKSSLMVRTANRLQAGGVRTAILDISTLGGGISTPEAWFFGFLDELAFQLGLAEEVNAWWEARQNHNPVQRFSNFLREVVLAEIQEPVVIFVDEIDSALEMSFADDFFAAIRAAFNARASHPEYRRLTFILLGVARPADLIRDRNRTPYNIGSHIHLSDFTLPELQPFQDVIEETFPGQGQEIVEWVLEWTNGQPYLTQKLCAELFHTAETPCTRESVAQTVFRLFFTEEARKESNLRAIRDRIESSPHKFRLLQVYEKILRGKSVLDEERSPAKNELKLTGLVRASAQGKSDPVRLEVRNRIYQTVFDQEWVQKNLPRSRTRQVTLLATLLVFLAFIVAGVAIYRQQIQPSLTFAEQFQTSNSPDVKLTSLARLLELDARSYAQAQELYSGLAHAERLSLFTGLSSPQNVAGELVAVIEAVYQANENSSTGNEILGAMRTVLGQIGAAGAPGLKTEIEFWLKGREEANHNLNPRTAVSFYDSAWNESVARGQPNYAVLYDRALAWIALEEFAPAYTDLQVVWEQIPELREAIAALIQATPALASAILENPSAEPAILAYITPVIPTLTPAPTPTRRLSPTVAPTPTPKPGTTDPTPVATQDGDYLVLHKELSGYENGDAAGGLADVLYPGDAATWFFNPAGLTAGFPVEFVISGVLDEYYEIPLSAYTIKVSVNGAEVFNGAPPGFQHGSPPGRNYVNWTPLSFEANGAWSLTIENTSSISAEHWIAFDWVELRVLTEIPIVQRFDCTSRWTRLQAGSRAAVLKDGTLPNRVRLGPSREDEIIALLYPGTVVKLIEGPVCADGLVFWRIQSGLIAGGLGWTAEGDGNVYFLEPYPP